jgi:hypothetical protein
MLSLEQSSIFDKVKIGRGWIKILKVSCMIQFAVDKMLIFPDSHPVLVGSTEIDEEEKFWPLLNVHVLDKI